MKKLIKQRYTQTIIYIIIWLLILLVIIFFSQNEQEYKWQHLVHKIVWFVPFFLVFLLNNALLTPRLLFRKKYILYFSITSVVILVISFPKVTQLFHDLIPTSEKIDKFVPPPRPEGHFPPNQPPDTFGSPGRPIRDISGKVKEIPLRIFWGKYLMNILLSFLVVGLNTAIKQASKLMQEERIRYQLQEEKLQAELSFLKHQISPHFLMNTLNNIHALVELDQSDAQNSIVRLSHMLRYLLYEKEDKKTSLNKEIEFIKSYTHLMRMRYSDNLDIKMSIPDEMPSVSIPPFVFITILENAFKYGANPHKNCFIHLSIYIEKGFLVVSCSNSKQNVESLPEAESGGIGLVNTKKRLELYFGDNYIWNISDKDDIYNSTIKIPIN